MRNPNPKGSLSRFRIGSLVAVIVGLVLLTAFFALAVRANDAAVAYLYSPPL
jgi:hypothetical protein